MRPSRLNMKAFCPEHPKWDQNLKFTPLSETTSIPTPFICRVPLPRIWNNQSFSFHLKLEGIRKGTKGGKREQVEWKSEMTEWKWRTLSDTIDRRTNIKESARHENEKQQSVEQGNSMTNRGDRRKREETIKFTGEWQMWTVSSEYLDLCLL